MTVSQWADRYRYLSAEDSSEPGKWRTDRAEYQRGIMDAFSDNSVNTVVVPKAHQVGWALALDTPLPTPAGWTTMGDVQVGDVLFDENGRPCSVTATTAVMHDHPCFTVRFSDGSEIVADAEHRWFVESATPINGRRRGPRSGVLTTAQIAESVTYRPTQRLNRYAIPVTGALECEPADLPVDPYVLGVWLGDGHLHQACLTLHADDACHVAPHFEAAGYVLIEVARTETNVLTLRIRLASDDRNFCSRGHDMQATGRTSAGYCAECARQDSLFKQYGKPRREAPRPRDTVSRRLALLGLLHTHKRVPAMYLRGSRDQRLAVLQGLIDTDGHVSALKGRTEFVNTSRGLVDDVAELACSLGLKPRISYRPPRGPDAEQWRVTFLAYAETPVARIPRKRERQKGDDAARREAETTRRRIVAVEPVASVPVRCITVDSPSHLYLCGRAMIPTHNTAMLGNVLGYHIHLDPGPTLMLLPTLDMGTTWSTKRLAPMIRDTYVLRGLIKDPRSRDSENTVLEKSFPGGYLAITGANSPASLASRPIRIVLADETDRYPTSAGQEGDPLYLASQRQTNFWNRKTLLGSTPTLRQTSVIWREWLSSDMRLYHVPCPHCDHAQVLRWQQVRWDKGPGGEHLPETAYYLCEECGSPWNDPERWRAVARGEWRATAPFNGVAGFHITGFMSPWVTLETIVRQFLKAKDNPALLQPWVNTVLGEPWEETGERVDEHALMSRLESWAPPPKQGELLKAPEGALVVTVGVDTQGDRLEAHRIAWGEGETSWSLDYRVFHGDPGEPEVWEDLDEYLLTPTRTVDGRTLPVAATCIDSGGHHAAKVYSFAKDRVRRKVWAVKGHAGSGKVIWPKRATKLKRGQGNLFMLGVDSAKDAIYARLRIADRDKPGFCHFPEGREKSFFEQLTSETVVTKHNKQGFPVREWQKRHHARNEALDTTVYGYAALLSLNLVWSREMKRKARADRMPDADDLVETEAVPEPPRVPVLPPPAAVPVRRFARRMTRSSLMS